VAAPDCHNLDSPSFSYLFLVNPFLFFTQKGGWYTNQQSEYTFATKIVGIEWEQRLTIMQSMPHNAVYATWTAASMLVLQLIRLQICKIVGLFWV